MIPKPSFLTILAFTWLFVGLGGCAGIGDLQQDVAIRDAARHAFRRELNVPANAKFARHFERGWRQAYYNISKGGDPCPPSVPPEPYWSVKYQSTEGCRQIAAWYDGYRRGVTAAQCDGRHLFCGVPVVEQCVRESAEQCDPVPERKLRAVDSPETALDPPRKMLTLTAAEFPIQQTSYFDEPTTVRLPPTEDGFLGTQEAVQATK